MTHAERRPADHHPRQLALVGGPRRRAHHASAAHDADAVADGAHLAELVADEDDREALGDETPQRLEEGFDLVRHEHGGRLVEDEEAAIARERLDDLDALLLADRELGHDGVRTHGDAEALGGLQHRPAGRVEVEAHTGGAAQDDVLGHAHGLHEREVLRDHAYAGGDGVPWRADAHRAPVDADRAGIGTREPVEDAHERRLAGPVLAEQGVDLAARQREVDVIVGDEVAEALADAQQFGGQVALAADLGHLTVGRRATRG